MITKRSFKPKKANSETHLFLPPRMEVWFGQVDPEHAEDKRGPLPHQPPHLMDRLPQEQVPKCPGNI